MVLTTINLTGINSQTKTFLTDNFTWIAFGTGTTPALASDTTLVTEILQKAIQESFTGSNNVIISGFLNSTEGNGSSIAEIGAKTGSGGTLRSRNVISPAIAKTSSIELWVDIDTTINVTQS